MTIVIALVIFLIVIMLHELGHFMAAKSVGIKVNEFSVGMGPAIWQKQKGETLYSLRAIPLGGYCAMEGEEEASDSEGSFSQAKAWERFLTVSAGVVMNFLVAWVCFALFLAMSGKASHAIVSGFVLVWKTFGELFTILGRLFTGALSMDAVSGPIGVIRIIGAAAKSGLSSLLFLTGYISTNLAFFNLLPIPALDGFTLLLILLEKIRGKALESLVEQRIRMVGFALLMALILFVSVKDVLRIF